MLDLIVCGKNIRQWLSVRFRFHRIHEHLPGEELKKFSVICSIINFYFVSRALPKQKQDIVAFYTFLPSSQNITSEYYRSTLYYI